MRLTIKHTTRYRFDMPVQYGLQQLRKTPKSSYTQSVLHWHTQISGGRKEAAYEDHHRNTVELISFDAGTQDMSVTSEGAVEVEETHGVLGAHQGAAPLWLYEKPTARTAAGAGTRALCRGVSLAEGVKSLHDLSDRIRNEVTYRLGASEPSWSAEDALAAGQGVCQDHTHIFLAACRHLGVPARYVSGYLMLNSTTTQDAMHAWAEAFVEGLGWVGFDISNGISPDTRYVRVATGLDYADAAPISGSRMGGADEHLDVQIQVIQQ